MRVNLLLVFLLIFSLSGCATAKRGNDNPQAMQPHKFQFEAGRQKNQLLTGEDERDYYEISQPAMIKKSESASKKQKVSKTSAAEPTETTSKNIQIALKKTGFYSGSIDGRIGKQTKKAIKNFQKANGLTADGVVGKETWSKLKKYL